MPWSYPRGVTQRVLDAVHGNGLEMALAQPLGGDASACCWIAQMELGNKGLASDFITSTHLRGRLPDCSKVRELEMDV